MQGINIPEEVMQDVHEIETLMANLPKKGVMQKKESWNQMVEGHKERLDKVQRLQTHIGEMVYAAIIKTNKS